MREIATNPFSYGMETYIFVIVLASVAGLVRFLNTCVKDGEFRFLVLIRDLFTGILAGLMAFWICEYFDLIGPLSNVAVIMAGVMGIRAIEEIKNIILNVLNASALNAKRHSDQQ